MSTSLARTDHFRTRPQPQAHEQDMKLFETLTSFTQELSRASVSLGGDTSGGPSQHMYGMNDEALITTQAFENSLNNPNNPLLAGLDHTGDLDDTFEPIRHISLNESLAPHPRPLASHRDSGTFLLRATGGERERGDDDDMPMFCDSRRRSSVRPTMYMGEEEEREA